MDGPGGFDSHALPPIRGKQGPPAYTFPVRALAFLALLGGISAPRQASEPEPVPAVVVVQLRGELAETWASLLRRAHSRAREAGARLFVVDMDTPGGEAELMKRIGDSLDAIGGDMETVAFISHRAWSAGSYVAMACSQIWMAPGASIGAAMPIQIGPGGIMPQLDPGVQEKILAAFRADFRAWAEKHHRNPGIAEAFVDNGIELKRISIRGQTRVVTGKEYDELLERGEQPRFLESISGAGELLAMTPQEASELGFCDGVAADLPALLQALGMEGAAVLKIEPNWSERLVSFLAGKSWLLLLGAAFFLFVSFQIPGLGAPEGLALLCILLFLFHGYLVGLAEWSEALLVLGGMALIAVELFVAPGTILPGALGGLLLFAGLLLSMQDFVLPEGGIEMKTFRNNLLLVLGMALFVPLLGAMAVRRLAGSRASRWMIQTPAAGFSGPVSLAGPSGEKDEVFIQAGDTGECLTPLRPSGTVRVAGVPFDARSVGPFLEPGTQVQVVRRQGGTLFVRPHGNPS